MRIRNIVLGAMAGIAGGMVFGMLMGMMGMLPMVAALVGSHSAVIGLIVHLMNSALIGGAFGFLFGREAATLSRKALLGSFYGVMWWFVGALIVMPLWLGMPVQLSLTGMKAAMPSLMGHIIYGVITGIVFNRLAVKVGHQVSPACSRT